MAITNESARLGGAGAGRKNRGARFISYPQYTPVSSRLQSKRRHPRLARAGYAVHYWLKEVMIWQLQDLAEWLFVRAWRWELGL